MDPEYYNDLMCMCVYIATHYLGADADHYHITFEARVLYGMNVGWHSERNTTLH